MTDHPIRNRNRIDFIHARLFDPNETKAAIEERFKRHLHKLKSQKAALNEIPSVSKNISEPYIDGTDDKLFSKSSESSTLRRADRDQIERRAETIIAKRKATSSLNHLKREDRERLELALSGGVKLVSIQSEHHADVLAAELHMDMPWMSQVSDVVWRAMRRSAVDGLPGLQIPPLLLDGPPGIGKSHFARRLGQLLNVPTTVIEATGESAGFGIVGSQRGWGSAHPGRVLETVLQSKIANPVIVVDEIDKCGTANSTSGISFGLTQALLPLLEPLTARSWSCPYYQTPFDMSHIIWILTANSSRPLPEPLLNRCPPISLRPLTANEVRGFVRREGKKRGISYLGIETMSETISRQMVLQNHVSLRDALRLLRTTADIENRPMLH